MSGRLVRAISLHRWVQRRALYRVIISICLRILLWLLLMSWLRLFDRRESSFLRFERLSHAQTSFLLAPFILSLIVLNKWCSFWLERLATDTLLLRHTLLIDLSYTPIIKKLKLSLV